MNSVCKKLKLKPNTSLLLMHAPVGMASYLEPLPEGCSLKESPQDKSDTVILFVNNRSELEAYYKQAVDNTKHEGLLWFAYPKGGSKIKSDLTRDAGWECVMALGFQWIALISLDDTYSAFAVKVGVFATPPRANAENKTNLIDTDGAVVIDYKTRIIQMPASIKKALGKDKEAIDFFEKLSFTNKKEYVLFVLDVKREETKIARVEKAAVYLKEGRKTPLAKA